MRRLTALMLVIGLTLLASPLLAQGYGGMTWDQPTHKLEIIPMYGYTWTVS